MTQIEIRTGSQVVIATNSGAGWSSRLYVNDGETATLVCAKHKSEAGVRKWAAKVLAV